MIKFENLEVHGWRAVIRGMRNPTKSWIESDSDFEGAAETDVLVNGKVRRQRIYYDALNIGPEDMKFMKNLIKAGPDCRNFLRMINVTADITAPLYWWDDFKTIFTHNPADIVMDECSLFDGLMDKEFTIRDFSCEHLLSLIHQTGTFEVPKLVMEEADVELVSTPYSTMTLVIALLNECRRVYIETNNKKHLWQIIQLLPSSYNQKRTVQLNYEVLANIYKSCKDHKLDEWSEHEDVGITLCDSRLDYGFCDWIKSLPYSELITGDWSEDSDV